MKPMFRTGGLAALAAAMMTLGGCVIADVEGVDVTSTPEIEHFTGVAKAGVVRCAARGDLAATAVSCSAWRFTHDNLSCRSSSCWFDSSPTYCQTSSPMSP